MFAVKKTRKRETFPGETAGYNHEEASKSFECNRFNFVLDNLTSQMRSRFKVIEEECYKISFLWSAPKSLTEEELRLKAENLAMLYPEDLSKNDFKTWSIKGHPLYFWTRASGKFWAGLRKRVSLPHCHV